MHKENNIHRGDFSEHSAPPAPSLLQYIGAELIQEEKY